MFACVSSVAVQQLNSSKPRVPHKPFIWILSIKNKNQLINAQNGQKQPDNSDEILQPMFSENTNETDLAGEMFQCYCDCNCDCKMAIVDRLRVAHISQ